MNPVVQRLKEIITEKDKTIEEVRKTLESSQRLNETLVSTYQKDNRPKESIQSALLFLNVEIPKARQRNKQVLKDLKKMLEYETKTIIKSEN